MPSALDRSHGESGDEPARAGVLSLRKSGGVETGLTPPPHFQTKSPLCGAADTRAGGGDVDPEGSRPSAAHGDESGHLTLANLVRP